MRERKRMLKLGMADVAKRKGIRFREEVDEKGDAAIALIDLGTAQIPPGAWSKRCA